MKSDMTIYHLVRKDTWGMYQKDVFYSPPSLEREGFIHCSIKEQVLTTANRRFTGAKDLLLMVIDTINVPSKIVFEDLRGTGEKHPHIYGKLPLSAIQTILPLLPNAEGIFTKLPIAFSMLTRYHMRKKKIWKSRGARS
ncbi:DUF952 domain-containing protein [Candidatus Gottesmanbacteria bacterium]|nr:DUF952 domain-containing protein [Candidatus Gottesmanbacteria bacterium]